MVLGRLDRQAKEVARINRQEQKRTGTHVLYAPRQRCACLGKSGNTNVVCRVCDGFGWFWLPQDEYTTRVVLQQANLHRELVNQGFVQHGDLVCQFDRAPIGLAPYDRLRINPNLLFTFGISAEASVIERTNEEAETLAQRAFRVLSVVATDSLTGAVVVYAEGTDYTYTENTNRLEWVAGRGPVEGAQYSISYLADYDWVVTQPASPLGLGGVGFQGKVILSRRMKDQRDYDDRANDPPPTDDPSWL